MSVFPWLRVLDVDLILSVSNLIYFATWEFVCVVGVGGGERWG